MSKLSVLIASAVVAMAVTVSPAFAYDFPHEKQSSKWSAIDAWDYNGGGLDSVECGRAEATGCNFSDTGTRTVTFFGVVATHSAGIGGSVGAEGEVEITSAESMAITLPAPEAQICYHRLTKEFWMRVPMATDESRVTFARVGTTFIGGHGYYANDLSFGFPSYKVFNVYYDNTGAHYVDFIGAWGANQLAIGPSENPDACDWPELA